MLEHFLKYIEIEKNYSAQTLRAYGDDLRQFFSFCGIEPNTTNFPSLSHRTIRNWLSQLLAQGVSPRSVNRKLSSLRSFYKYILRRGIVSNNPLHKVVAPKTAKRLPVFLNNVDTTRLLDTVEYSNDFLGLRDLVVLEFFYFTGVRVSELATLKSRDISLSNSTIKVMGKGSKERIIPIHPELKEIVTCYIQQKKESFPEQNDGGYFIVTDKGAKPYTKLLYRIVNKYMSMVTSLEKKSPHVLRHTFATHLLNGGADINAIKELLGHANLSATQVYTHTTIDKLKTAYSKAHPRA